MGIEEKLNADIKTAMLAKEAAKLEALRAMKSVVLLLKTSNDCIQIKITIRLINENLISNLTDDINILN